MMLMVSVVHGCCRDAQSNIRAVLTKVIVYCGISLLATELVPIAFELLGLGLN